MKRMLAIVLVLMVMIPSVAFAACDCYCGCYSCSCNVSRRVTTLVVADRGYDYTVRTNVREDADKEAKDIGTLYGRDTIDVTNLYFTEDGQIWCETWYKDQIAYVSMKHLQPVKNVGSFFWLENATKVIASPKTEANTIGWFRESQIVRVDEIIRDSNDTYWGKVLCDGNYGYIPMTSLNAMW